jgi:hypothetical protein
MNKKRMFAAIVATVIATIVVMLSLGASIAAAGGSANAPAPPILDKLPPTWSQIIPGEHRFEVVLNGEAVLDKETGLVWQRSPWNSQWDWNGGQTQCNYETIGGRMGWHLPTVEQLTSLIDKSSSTSRKLPDGHPFGTVWSRYPYWTASTYPGAPDFAFAVDFKLYDDEEVNPHDVLLAYDKSSADPHVWCVRGGQSYAGY